VSSSPVFKLGGVGLHPVPPQAVGSAGWSINRTVREMYALRTSYKDAIHAFQERFIVNVLIAHSCHLGKAAQELGMHRNTLTRAIRDLDIDLRQIRTASRRG
jgi:Fis family transcriptional regulator